MSDSGGTEPLPQATVEPPRRTRLSVIWIIPILAAVVAIGIAVQRIVTEGPTITVVFKSAEGIEAGKTFVKVPEKSKHRNPCRCSERMTLSRVLLYFATVSPETGCARPRR